jgi:hypothetical protein
MDSDFTVLGLGADPRIFKYESDPSGKETATAEKPILTYNPKGSDDFDPFGVFDVLEILEPFSFFF